MNSKHTPTPWQVLGGWDVATADGGAIAQTNTTDDAAFIVRAVNAHDDLVAILRNDVLPVVMNYKATHDKPGCVCIICSLPDMIRAALAKAEGGAA